MKKATTIIINGKLYDATTGKPMPQNAPGQPKAPVPKRPMRAFSDIGPHPSTIARPQTVTPTAQGQASAKARDTHLPAQAIHAKPQKSHTLYRKALKKPETTPQPASFSTQQLPTRSPLISRFHSNATVHTDLTRKAERASQAEEAITPAQTHPTVAKILQQTAPAPVAQASGKELKEQLIKERLAEVSDSPKVTHKQSWLKSKPRMASVLTATLALLVLGGYLTYMNLPVISMKVAASRAGVSATFPNYRPDGYGLNGPITYSPGEVNINYKSNTNDNSFKISQKHSNWDSQALLDNYVTRQTENYLTFQERGVTVYTFGNKAAWVNGGLLYTLDGNASLSSDQVLRLATSM
ncbi:MAG TPA: hypothetical protein VFO38_05880 [Candidatus Saccharimonadales bacterium]|nr:hypothetical protein [Candidatus Saccharimonadales bacterium]